jgi:hypothetical protein
MTLRVLVLLACNVITLVAFVGYIVLADHRDRDSEPLVRVSHNAGILRGSTLLFPAVADVSVSSGSEPANLETELSVTNSEEVETRTFLKFDVSGVSGSITSARILLRSKSDGSQGGELREILDTAWSENAMTWQNQPFIDLESPAVSSVAAVRSGDTYEWDVLQVIHGNGTHAFALTCTDCASIYESREVENPPYLRLVLDDGTVVPPGNPADPFLVGAGDIAICPSDPASSGAEQTALLLDAEMEAGLDGTVFTAGDHAYYSGTTDEFLDCYDPTWGRHKSWTAPSPGNHGYRTSGAAAYFTYFGAAAGDPSKGYYSYELGDWHVVALNSNCDEVGGCDQDSPQETWLRADLAASEAACTIAYMHHPRFSSGKMHGSQKSMEDLFTTLYEAGADVVVAGHDHHYERFAPQDPQGVTDLETGIRMFVVGTGGFGLRSFATPIANSEARFNSLFGVLKLILHPTGYDWAFISVAVTEPEPVEVFSDAGSALCH